MPNSLNRLTSLLILSGSLLLATGVPHAQDPRWIQFDDLNLEAAMVEFLEEHVDQDGNPAPLPPTLVSVQELIFFVAQGKNIVSLVGIDQLSSLNFLDLEDNDIIEIGPLETMTQLTGLSLDTNKISDISPLASLSAELTSLNLRANAISDISDLAGLIKLTSLDLISNQISDLRDLEGLIQLKSLNLESNNIINIDILASLSAELTTLELAFNKISDIKALSGLTNLTILSLSVNEIGDNLGPLEGLTKLTDLDLVSNSITDITPLARLNQLTILRLDSNSIRDINPLVNMTQLDFLRLDSNSISDINPLAGMTQLTTLDLSSNPISDIRALVNNTGLGAEDSIELTSTLLGLDDCADLQTLIDREVSVTHDVNCDATVLVANYMNRNLISRVYLWNPTASRGEITVRVFSLPTSDGTAHELTNGPLPIGNLEAKSALNIRLVKDILDKLPGNLEFDPFDGGNLTLEFTIGVTGVGGSAQVFSETLAFGTYPLQRIPSTSSVNPTVLAAHFMNGNNSVLNSRIYLWNPSDSLGDITVRVFTLPIGGKPARELTGVLPFSLGSLEGKSALNIRLAEDILDQLPEITRPYYTDDGGNLVLEFTITAASVRGVAQVFSVQKERVPRAFGTYPLRVIQ